MKFRTTASKSSVVAALGKASLQAVRSYRTVPGLHLVKAGAADPDSQQAKLTLQQRDDIEYIEPNFVVRANVIPNDPHFGRLQGLHNTGQTGSPLTPDIDAPEAWDITTGSSEVVIAIVDTGVDYGHEDLAGNMFHNLPECTADGIDSDANGYVDDCHGIDTGNGDADPIDDFGHGTHVAGTIGAVGNNGIGVTGVAWSVRLLACKFLDERGFGSTADAIACLDYIATLRERGVNIVASNNSWGGYGYSRALHDAIVAQRQRGILFVASAGNDRFDVDVLPHYPCAHEVSNIICVASSYDGLSIFSNFGTSTVHLGAPGDDIISASLRNSYDIADGTSMAAPHVSGTIALLASQDATRDWRALKNLVLAGAVPPIEFGIPTITERRLNAARSLSCVGSIVRARLRPFTYEELVRPVGAAVPLRALHIDCASPAGPVSVAVAPTGEVVTLADDGGVHDEVAGDGIYSGVWTTHSAGTYTLSFPGIDDETATVRVDPQLERGFPIATFSFDEDGVVSGGESHHVLVGNIDGDPELEILTSGLNAGPLYAWNHDGSEVTGWPVWDAFGSAYPTLGEFDGDPLRSEVVARIGFSGIHVYSGAGTLLPGWPRFAGADHAIATVDVDADGRDEIISYPALRYDGSRVNPSVDIPVAPSWAVGPAAVADLDADGQPDFIVADQSNIWASNVNGVLPGFPTFDPRAAGVAVRVFPVVGDVDGDGSPEIVIASPASFDTWCGRVHVFSNKGVYERTLVLGTNTDPVRGPALADLDGDGVPEILMSSHREVHAWKGDGSRVPGWPVTLSTELLPTSSPVVGDITGDGLPDVVVLSGTFNVGPGLLHAFNRDGTVVAGFPRTEASFAAGRHLAIADIDLDGRNEIIVASLRDIGFLDTVYVYDLGGASHGAIEWGQYQGAPTHRGYYELGRNLPSDAYLTVQVHGAGRVAGGGLDCGADCIERHARGTRVALTATADPAARFNRWLGACAGQGNPCTVSINRYTSVAAQFDSPLTVTVSGPGSVTSSPAGISCPTDCNESFDARTVVMLTPTPAPGADFDGWTGACTGQVIPCRVTIDGVKSVAARFVTARRMTVAVTGAGRGTVTSSPAGIDCGNACSFDFAPDTVVTLTAQPAADSYRTSWSGDCMSFTHQCTVTMDTIRNVSVDFALKPVLNVTRSGAGTGFVESSPRGISCGTTCSQPMEFNSLVQLFATPAPDSMFVGWSGDCTGSGPCSFIITADKAINAEFALKPTLAVTVSGHGRVSITPPAIQCSSSCSTSHSPGAVVMLVAAAEPGSQFAGWSGACSGQAADCRVTIDRSRSVTATFTSLPPGSGGSAAAGSGGGGRLALPALLVLGMLTLLGFRRAQVLALG